jgi:hypothetical protein
LNARICDRPIRANLGWLFSAVSLPFAIYFYIEQRTRHSLSYDIFHRVIMPPTTIGNVRVFANYAGHEVPCLIESILLLKTTDGVRIGGKGTILGGQFVVMVPGSSNPTFNVIGSDGGIISFNFL